MTTKTTTSEAAGQGRAAAYAWRTTPATREPVNPYLTPDMAYGRERISALALAWRAGFAHETHHETHHETLQALAVKTG